MSGSNARNRPIVSVKIRPRDPGDHMLYEALSRFIEHYPIIGIALDSDSKLISFLGTDLKQLEKFTTPIRRKFWSSLEIGEPEVIYLETIRSPAEAESKYIKQTGGSGNYAHVKLRLEPIGANKDLEFAAAVSDEIIPNKFFPAVEQGVRESATRGIQSRELVGVKAILYNGSYHEIDSNEMAFRIAGETAFNEAVANAGRVLLEPIMAVEITVPEEYAEIVKREFVNRRGRITGSERRENSAVIHAIAPLAEMLGYKSPELKMHFLQYAEAPLPEEYGEAGMPARTPRGPKPKHGFTSLPEPE